MADKPKKADDTQDEALSAEQVQAETIEKMGSLTPEEGGGLRSIDPAIAEGKMEVDEWSDKPTEQPKKK